MAKDKYGALRLENQLCFPLYACSKEIIKKYTPLLEKLDLTYTQYIAMLVMWEKKELPMSELCELLFLDSGTLTPLLKKLEGKGYIKRERSIEDERSVIISITKTGDKLKDKALEVPVQMGACISLSQEDAKTLYRILYQLLDEMR